VGSEEFGVKTSAKSASLGLLLADILGDGFATDLFFRFEDNFTLIAVCRYPTS